MADNRVYDGFRALPAGMNGGMDASLIGPDQCAASCNLTFRDGFARTRPPFSSQVLTFNSENAEANWTGKFQGAVSYNASFGSDGFVVSRGGRLFRIEVGSTNLVSEITPQLSIVTTADFTVPAPGGSVQVFVNSETVIPNNATVFIDSGEYTVSSRGTNSLILVYVGSAAHATAVAGNSVLDVNGNQFIEYQVNPADQDFVYLFQAENYVIVLGGQSKTIIYDGTSARQAGLNEVPSGVLGVYAWGRIWVVLTDYSSFVAGDLIRDPSGTEALGFVDSILKFTSNDFLNEGGSFGVPKDAGKIRSMIPLATQDTSLGVGPILVGTTNAVFSVNAPVDRTTWKNLTYPIQTVSLIDYGPQGPRSTISVGGDMWYRSLDGFRSFIVARREITSWGQTPNSREVAPLLDFDTESLLFFGSSVLFDNKFYSTFSPNRTTVGVAHQGLAVINFDLLSTMREKVPPAWEGANTGLNVLQILKGTFGDTERAFMFVERAGSVALWEVLKEGAYDLVNTSASITRNSVESFMETKQYDFATDSGLKMLYTAELYLDEVVDNISITIKWRPDEYPNWTTWHEVALCATVSQCAPVGCGPFVQKQPQYAARVMLPLPPEVCNELSKMPLSRGYKFQFRIEGTGFFRLKKFRVHAKLQPDNMEGSCPPSATCDSIEGCNIDYFTYNSYE